MFLKNLSSRNRYFILISGYSSILAGIYFIATLLLTLLVLAPKGYLDVLENQDLIPEWISQHWNTYRYLWLLLFLNQLFLVPVPFAVEEQFRVQGSFGEALLRMGTVLGVASVIMTMISLIIYYAATPVIGEAWVKDKATNPELVIRLNDIIASIGTMTRVFAEFLLCVWLFTISIAINRKKIGNTSAIIIYLATGITLVATGTKIFIRSSPLELIMPFFLGACWFAIGKKLLESSRASSNSSP